MKMTLEKEGSLQVNIGQLSAGNGTLPFGGIPEDAVCYEHGKLGTPTDSDNEEKQPLVSEDDISSQTDPASHEDGRHESDHCMYDTNIFHEQKMRPDPNAHLLEHREGFLERSAIIGPLNILACAPTPPTTAGGPDVCKRMTTLQKGQNIAYFSELQKMNVTAGTGLIKHPKTPIDGKTVTYPESICQAVFNRTGKSGKELNLDKGDILQVLDSRGDWWKLKNHKGEVGHAPYVMLQVIYGPGINQKPKRYFSRRKHIIVIIISVAIIVFIVVIGVMQIKRPPFV